MKKIILLFAIFNFQLSTFNLAKAGGLMTNTNYHIAFDRMMARGASIDIDAAYSNPAGLAWGHNGWQLSLNVQKPYQYRNIETALAQPYATAVGFEQHKFKGKASANPFVPALFASYRHDRWALSMMAGIVGSGGKVTYDEGIPMLVVPIRAKLAAGGLTSNYYDLDAYMQGKQYIYGIQANFTYRFNDHWSAAVGVRGNIYSGFSRGHLIANVKPEVMLATGLPAEALNMQLDVDQKGFGVCPMLSVNYRLDRLLITGRYEFRSRLNIPNETNALSIAQVGQPTADIKAMAETMGNAATVAALTPALGQEMVQKIGAYLPDEKMRYDMPGLLSVAVGYEFVPSKFRGTLEYHWFDDKRAKMAGERQDALTHGTQEILAGLEWDISKVVTVSAGGQRTDYGLSDEYQSNTSFACDSYSVGLGAAFNVIKGLRVNIGYFCSIYKDYTRAENYGSKSDPMQALPATETFSRTNHVFGIGIDYKF